jgi:hypothetical protein
VGERFKRRMKTVKAADWKRTVMEIFVHLIGKFAVT